MMYINFLKNNKGNKGYTLLFAVLVSSLVLSVGISILTISKKEFLLASSARDSTTAFYAANSALECAVYWNDNGDKFNIVNPNLTGMKCADTTLAVETISQDGYPVFTFHMKFDDDSCAIVNVKHYGVWQGSAIEDRVVMDSHGYNIGWTSAGGGKCLSPSPRRVERVLYYDTFSQAYGVITVGKAGAGTGVINSATSDLFCDVRCTYTSDSISDLRITFPSGVATIYANANPIDSRFIGWTVNGNTIICGSVGRCDVPLNEGSKYIVATFESL